MKLQPTNEAVTPLVAHIERRDTEFTVERSSGRPPTKLVFGVPGANITVAHLLHLTRREIGFLWNRIGECGDAERAAKHIGLALGNLLGEEAKIGELGAGLGLHFDECLTPMAALAIVEIYLALDRQAPGHELAMREVVTAIGFLHQQMRRADAMPDLGTIMAHGG